MLIPTVFGDRFRVSQACKTELLPGQFMVVSCHDIEQWTPAALLVVRPKPDARWQTLSEQLLKLMDRSGVLAVGEERSQAARVLGWIALQEAPASGPSAGDVAELLEPARSPERNDLEDP